MAWSKETRIKLFIGVDVVFFLLEIIIGYTAHSLALVADAFHMLNDVISLCVGLWAVRVATKRSSSKEYTYGWARAEILGGLVNGVFLVALCLSIVLDAIQRFFEPQEVKNPKLVLIVGGVGLAFNILGLFVFHQHSHSHGHDHATESEQTEDISAAEQGHAHIHSASETTEVAIKDQALSPGTCESPQKAKKRFSISWQQDAGSGSREAATLPSRGRGGSVGSRRNTIAYLRRSGSRSYDPDDIPIHPAQFRQSFRTVALYGEDYSDSDQSSGEEEALESSRSREPTESSPLLGTNMFKSKTDGQQPTKTSSLSGSKSNGGLSAPVSHTGHKHTQQRDKPHGGHNHEDMNIRGMFLHVLGDALGNVGVMASALIIWLAPWPWRFYFDPIISLFITLIILKSALPLCKETAKPLLQAVPGDLSLDDIKEDIQSLPGVRSCHHLHVWALTPSKRIATLDVQMDFSNDAKKYMDVAREIKKCLQGFGIHSSTIQPEFLGQDGSCMLDSFDTDEADVKCCTPGEGSGTATPRKSLDKHDHAH